MNSRWWTTGLLLLVLCALYLLQPAAGTDGRPDTAAGDAGAAAPPPRPDRPAPGADPLGSLAVPPMR